jgi:hypothetical protein
MNGEQLFTFTHKCTEKTVKNKTELKIQWYTLKNHSTKLENTCKHAALVDLLRGHATSIGSRTGCGDIQCSVA